MSVSDLLSPMSVDKSAIQGLLNDSNILKIERERFFNVEEYQKDILAYLKNSEVRFFNICLICFLISSS